MVYFVLYFSIACEYICEYPGIIEDGNTHTFKDRFQRNTFFDRDRNLIEKHQSCRAATIVAGNNFVGGNFVGVIVFCVALLIVAGCAT